MYCHASRGTILVNIRHFFDPTTRTLSYVVFDETTKDAVIIDPVLDFDPVNLAFSDESMTALLGFVESLNLQVHFVLETHIHADHVTAASRLRERLGAKVVASVMVPAIQETFKGFLRLDDQRVDGSGFDLLMSDGDVIRAGVLEIEGIHTPGHTPACMSYKIDDVVFTGDAMFMPDSGTGRCDFPKGDAGTLYESVTEKLYALPDSTRVFVGHDYQPGGRELAFKTTIGANKKGNIQLTADTAKEQFIAWRAQRDASLDLPKLIFQSVQLNINAGQLPPLGKGEFPYLKIPILKS